MLPLQRNHTSQHRSRQAAPVHRLICSFLLLLLAASAGATPPQTDEKTKDRWSGVWTAQDTPFTLRVSHLEEGLFIVEPVETMGLVWTTRNGVISGDSATIEVEYQGVTGRVLVQLIDGKTAVARAMSCQPDYHVVCALVRNQQATFLKSSLAGQ